MSSADQVKKAMVDLFYPSRPDGSKCLDRLEWLAKGYKSLLEEWDIHLVLQVHDELVFDIPNDTPYEILEQITDIMANTITNDIGVEFKSDIEISPYWGGNFTREQVEQIIDGSLDWRSVFNEEVEQTLDNFDISYKVGDFLEVDEDEEDFEV